MDILHYNELPKINSARWMSVKDLNGEEWKDIKGYEGKYLISNYGRVKGLRNERRTHSHIMKLTIAENGYIHVGLRDKRKQKTFKVHRLVCMAFLSNIDNLPHVNHKDENPSNNTLENLEWCTAKYNSNYGTKKERLSKKMGELNMKRPVSKYTISGEYICSYPSISEAAPYQDDSTMRHIWECCNYKRLSAKGYTYRYADEKSPVFKKPRITILIQLYKDGKEKHSFHGYREFASFCGVSLDRAFDISKGEKMKAIKGYDVKVVKELKESQRILYSSL